MVIHIYLGLFHNKTYSVQYQPPRCSSLALRVVCRLRPFTEPPVELRVTVRGTLRCKWLTEEEVFVELTEVFCSFVSLSCSIRGEGTGETSSDEFLLSFIHSWNCDKEDRRWFQS